MPTQSTPRWANSRVGTFGVGEPLGSLVWPASVGRLPMLPWVLLACLSAVCIGDHLTQTNSTRSLPANEIAALMDFYTRTGGPSWNISRGWGGGTDPCTWYAIVWRLICSVDSRLAYGRHAERLLLRLTWLGVAYPVSPRTVLRSGACMRRLMINCTGMLIFMPVSFLQVRNCVQ
jgi:hypothetical protein